MAKFQVERAHEQTALRILSRLATVAGSLPGCSGCALVRGEELRAPYILVEEWDSEESLQRHFNSQGFLCVLTHFGARLGASETKATNGRLGPDERPVDAITLQVSRAETSSEFEEFARAQAQPRHDP